MAKALKRASGLEPSVRDLDISPSASRLINSLRDVGYSFETAVADVLDNSISAGATNIGIWMNFKPNDSYLLVVDDGDGMHRDRLAEALRFGSRRSYGPDQLGKFGLGLKTGSLSQCRRLTLLSRAGETATSPLALTLDLDEVERTDTWTAVEPENSAAIEHAETLLGDGPGTVVIWENLDRVLPDQFAYSAWGRRRIQRHAETTTEHLAMVFHRFLSGSHDARKVNISVNGESVIPWDPFALDEPETISTGRDVMQLEVRSGVGNVALTGYVLPPRDRFSSPEAFERLSGPLKWNRQQGLYFYRGNRLVQCGGWSGIRGIDEHTKLARASVDFEPELDEVFQVNIAKMSVALPSVLKKMAERPIQDLCAVADETYREASRERAVQREKADYRSDNIGLRDVGVALKAALLETTGVEEFRPVLDRLKERNPELGDRLGL